MRLLRYLVLIALLASAHSWVLGGKKGGKDAPVQWRNKPKTQTKLPPTTFVRIFALPSEEAKMAQVRSSNVHDHIVAIHMHHEFLLC